MLTSKDSLEIMKHCFPSWSDIRKRTNKSEGGNLLKAFSNEYDKINKAIKEYRDAFFLMNYQGLEDTIPDYLYMGLVGTTSNIHIDSFPCEVTENEDLFLNNLDTMVLARNGYILIHENLLPEGMDKVLYSVDKNQYSAEVIKVHIWNVFDEFAKFAGLERYDQETNKELSARILAQFKNFPNPTELGLKHAIQNALVSVEDVKLDQIKVQPLSDIDISDKRFNEIFEEFLNVNKDLFRTKVWNRSYWENGFSNIKYMPHAWDKPTDLSMDGVGSNDSLKVNFLENLNESNTTKVTVSGYKKDYEKIKRYVDTNRIESDIQLKLERYGDDIKPKKVEYKICACDAVKLSNPENVYIKGTRRFNGVKTIPVEDIVKDLKGINYVMHGSLEPNKKYRLKFTPKSAFSDMTIERCQLSSKQDDVDLRKEYDQYKLKNDIIRNQYIAAHITTTYSTANCDNVINSAEGMTVGGQKVDGSFDINVSGMDQQMVNYEVSCREVDITQTAYVRPLNGFKLEDNRIIDTNVDSLGTITVGGGSHPLYCNTLSLTLDKSEKGTEQGAIKVTVFVDGEVKYEQQIEQPGPIHYDFESRKRVEVIIQKYGQNTVSISGIKMSSYDIDFSMNGEHHLQHVGKIMRLPGGLDEAATLHVKIVPYTSAYPAIKYIHIGGSLHGAHYDVDVDTTGKEQPRLNIRTDCDVTLYELDGEKEVVVGEKKKYSTVTEFQNRMSEDGYIILDLSGFVNIRTASKEIGRKFQGTEKSYITLAPGESISTIDISGEIDEVVTNKSIYEYLFGDNVVDKEVFVSRTDDGKLLVRDTRNLTLEKRAITADMLDSRADTFAVTGNLPDGVTGLYYTGAGKAEIATGKDFNSGFAYISLAYTKAKKYVGYNTASLITEELDDVELINTLSPVTTFDKLHYYEIEVPENHKDTKIVFTNSQKNYSLGLDTLCINTELPAKNVNSWPLDVKQVSNKYILSNEIPLESRYVLDGEYHELQEYIVIPAEGIDVNYEISKPYRERITVKNTMVTKLKYSNVTDVKVFWDFGSEVTDYSLMGREGIILWNDNQLIEEPLIVEYKVRTPVFLTYNKKFAENIYRIIDFDEEAYRHIETKTFDSLKDGDVKVIEWKELPDKVVTKCDNPAFNASVESSILTVAQIKTENSLAIHNGYIYDSGLEYYYFNDKYQDHVDRVNAVEFHNVSRMRDRMLFHIKSHNFLPYANMEKNSIAKLTSFDMSKMPLNEVSEFNHMTSCESFNKWFTVNMKVSLTSTGSNEYGIHFKGRSGEGYAAIDISAYMKKGNIISLKLSTSDKSATVGIIRETDEKGLFFTKSMYLRMENQKTMEEYNGFRYFVIEEEPEENVRYYLVFKGKEGIIDDLISLPYTDLESMTATHVKNISKLHMEITEKAVKDTVMDVEFTADGGSYNDLIYNKETNELTTTSSIEYGLTQIGSVNLRNCQTLGADYSRGMITAVQNDAFIQTQPIFIHSKSSVYEAYVKINSIISGKYKDFNVTVYGSNSQNGYFAPLVQAQNVNVVAIPRNLITSYMYVEIIAGKSKVIYSIEVYARYAELDTMKPLVPVQKTNGSFTSKIYDLGVTGNFVFDKVVAESNNPDNVTYEIRGIREGKTDYVFTPWRKMSQDAKLDDYGMVQFRITIRGADTVVSVKDYRLVVSK